MQLPDYNNYWSSRLPKIFDSATWFIGINQTFLMVAVGLVLAGFISALIISLFGKSEDDDEDDYDII